jgi:hypothetical protein
MKGEVQMRRLGLLCGVALAMLGFGAANAQAAVLDANCPGPSDDGTDLEPNARFAQTFTALHTGTVVRAQVALNKDGTDGDFTAQILNTDASGVPVNGVLGSGTVPGSSLPTGATTLDATFSAPAPVTAGHQYALVITRPELWDITDRHANPCQGEEFFALDATSPFEPNLEPSQYDFVYSVFVNPTNAITVGKQKGNKLTLTVPGPGTLTVGDAAGAKKGVASAAKKKKSLKTSKVTVAAAGPVTVKLKLTKGAKQRLRQKGKLSVKGAITFTPTGGDPGTQTKKLKFKS